MSKESVKSIFAKAVLAGVLIGIGGIVYLSADNKYMGAFLFSLGLFTIVQFGLALYTGKVGYIPENKPSYLITVLTALVGNVCGTGLAALLVRFTRIGPTIHEKAAAAMSAKMDDTVVSQLILGFFCGMLMYIAVENAKNSKAKNADFSAIFGISLPVMTFILCGFNHSIADCFYMFAADPSPDGLLYILIIAVGNAAGGIFIPLVKKLFDKT